MKIFLMKITIAMLVASVSVSRNSEAKSKPLWCIAKSSAQEEALKNALDWACSSGGADCSQIQLGQNCYLPNTIRDHASFAFNNYYQHFKQEGSCDFQGLATTTSEDPSHDACQYDYTPGSQKKW